MFQIPELSVCIKIISIGLAHRNSLFVVFLDIALSQKNIYDAAGHFSLCENN